MKHIMLAARNAILGQFSTPLKFLLFFSGTLIFNSAFSQCYNQPSYCIPTTTNVNSYSIGLQNVTLTNNASGNGSINNSTTATGLSPNYNDYTSQVLTGKGGDTINVSIKNGSGNSTQARIFIDYNLDGTLSTSSPELVWSSSTTTAGATVTGTFIIPSSQAAGVYRIRVTGDLGGSSANTCSLGYGEQEDYSLVVTSSTKDALAYTYTAPSPYFVSGNNTISFSMFNLTNSTMTSVDIGYKLDNNSAVTQSLSSLSVAAGNKYTATFSTPLNISSVGTYTLKMWLNNVNGGGTQTAANDTICRTFTYCAPLSGNYTIDPSGSGSTNYKRFGEADSAMMNCGISGPVVFTVAAGTYTQQLTIPAISGASATNTITFDGGAGNASTRTLTNSSTSSAANFTVKLDGAQYVRFKNMTIAATNTSFGTAVLFANNASNDSFYNVTLTSVSTSSNSTNLAVINCYGASLIANNIRFDTCTINNGAYGAYMGSSGTSSLGASSQGTWFNNCNFNNQYAYGTYCYQMDGIKLTNNRISTNSSFTSFIGMYNYWIMVLADSNKTRITGNKISGAVGGYGITSTYLGVNSTVSAARRYLIANNFIQIGSGSNAAVGYSDNNGQNNDIVHNSINLGTSQTTNASAAILLLGTAYGGNTVQNNIFAAYNGAPCIRVDNFTYYPTLDYNNYFTSGLIFGYSPSGAVGGFASWKTATSKDANSFNVPTQYTSNTDLHYTSSCLKGVSGLGLITTDIDGQTRNSTPNIGADEVFSGNLIGNNLGVEAIVSPAFGFATGTVTIKIRIRNFGNNQITSCGVGYKINGGSAVTQSVTGLSLNSCDTTTITFTTTASVTSCLSLKVFTYSPNGGTDSLLSNDTMTQSILYGLNGSYTINPSGSGGTNFTTFAGFATYCNCGTLTGPVNVNVASGTYYEQAAFSSLQGSSSTNTLTLDGGSASSTTLSFRGTVASNYHTLRLDGANYFTIRNLTIRSTDGTNGWPLHIKDSRVVRIANCNIKVDSAGATATGANLSAITVNGSNSSLTTTSPIVDSITVDTCSILGGYYGVYANGTFNSIKFINILNSNIDSSYFYGTYCSQMPFKIKGNNIRMRRNGSTSSYGSFFSSCVVSTNGYYHEYSNNKIMYQGQYGVNFSSVYNAAGATASPANQCYNNMIGGGYRATGAVQCFGIYNNSTFFPWNIYHNSINVDNASTGGNRALYTSSGSTTNVNFQNNVFAITNSSATNAIPVEFTATTVAQNVGYNNYYSALSGTPTLVRVGASNYTSSAGLTTAWSSGGGTGSVNMNPNFTSATDLHSTNTSADGLNLLSSVPLDIDGNSRVNPPDMGADEVLSASNVGVTAIFPTNPVASGTQSLSARIKNFGTSAQSNIPVVIRMNGTRIDSVTYSGPLNAGDSALVSFTNTYNFSTCVTAKGYTNMSTDTYRGDDTTTVSYNLGFASNYTINSGAAASSTNFTSFASCIATLNNSCYSASGPITITVSANTYTEQVSIGAINGTSATNTVTFVGAGIGSTILTAAGTAAAPHTLRFNGCQWVIFRKMSIRGTDATNTWVVNSVSSNNNAVRSCQIECTGSAATATGANVMTVVVNGSTTAASTTGSNTNNFIDSNTIVSGYYGVADYCSTNTNILWIRNNTFTNAYQSSIYLSVGGPCIKILNNNIQNRSTNTSSSGINLINANSSSGVAGTQHEIKGNTINNVGTYGILTQTANGGNGTTVGEVYNNFIGGSFYNTGTVYCVSSTSGYYKYYHNTFVIANNTTSTSIGFYQQNVNNNNDIRNNIFAIIASGTNNLVPLQIDGSGTTNNLDYNLYYNSTGSTLLKSVGSTYTSSNFNSAFPNGGGTSSLNVYPDFTSSTNYHITSVCNNGTNLSVSTDIDGNSRGSSPDIGADENSSSPAKDVSVQTIVSPGYPLSTGAKTVVARIKNLGSNSISSLTVYYKHNSNAVVSQTFSFSPALNQCDTISVTFSTQATMINGSNTLKVYTALSGDAVASNDTAQFTLCPTLAGTYTIHPTTGDYTSFSAAVSALTCGGITGPVTFNVSANSYSEQISIGTITGSSSTNTVSFVGAGSSSTTLTFATTNTNPHVVRMNGSSYVNFSNMAIKSSGTSDGWIVNFIDAQNCKVSNCLIEFSNSTAQSSTGSNLACIVVNGSTTTMSTASSGSDNIFIDTCNINYGYYNVYLSVNNSTTNPTMYIRGDSMTNAYFSSIHIPSTYTLVYKILNNKITLRSSGSGQYGLYSFANNPSTTGSKFNEISGNKMSSLNGNAIGLWYGGSNTAGSPGQIFNNVLGGNSRGATTLIGYNISCCTNTQYWNIYNNTFILDYSSGTSYGYNALTMSSATGVNIKNNIFYNTSTTANNIAINASSSGAINTLDYNDFYTAYSGGTLATIGGITFTSSNYKAAYPSGLGLNSLNSAVNFVSSSNFHHSTGCLNGQTGLGVTKDNDNATRNTPSSMGAYEVSGIAAKDAGIFAITNPSFPVASGTQSIKAIVKNYGTDSISSVTAYYILNGASAVSQTFNFSPALQKCDTITVTFTTQGTINLGANTLKVYTVYSGDGNTGNDTLQGTYCPAMSGTYTINPSGSGSSNFTSFNAAVSQLQCGGIGGTVTFNVSSGTYSEQVVVPAIIGTSAANQIIFQSATGVASDVVLTASGSSTNNYTVSLTGGANNIKFRNMTISATNTSFGTALLYGGGANSDSFYNVTFNGISTTTNTTNLAVIVAPSSTVSNFMYFDTCRINNGAFGTYIQSSSSNIFGASSRGTGFNNCDFTNQYAYGMYNQYLDGIKLTNNRITTNSSLTSYNGMYNYWIMVLADASKSYITGNRVAGAQGGYGMQNTYLGVNSTVNSTRSYIVANNFIQIGSGSNGSYGLYDNNGNGVNYLYNTVNVTNTSNANTSSAAYFAGTAYGSDTIRNNIFSGSNGAPAIRIDNTSYYPVCNYNDLYTTGTNLGYSGTGGATASTTIGNWRTNTSRDANSKNIKPDFVSTADLHITNKSCMDNGGTPISWITSTDIDAQSRSASTPDIGADEFSAISYDIAMQAIVSPASTSIAGSTAYTIKVRLKNNGSTTISNIAMNYQVTGGSVVSETFTPGTSLAACDTATFTFATTLTFPSGTSTLKIYSTTMNSGNTDQDHSNDTIQNTFCTPFAGNLTINPSGGATSTNFTSFSNAASRLVNCGISGNVIIDVSDGIYNESVAFTGTIPGSHAGATITFRPASGDTGVWINSSTSHAFSLSGAKYIIFDGRPGGIGTTGVFNVYQTGSSFGAFNLTNDANRDTIRYCNLYSNTSASVGTITIGTTTATTGNDSICIENCLFNQSSGIPSNHIFAQGTASKENDYITIRNNTFLNAWLSGSTTVSMISTQGNNRFWNILNNNFTNTSIKLPSGAVTTNLTAILINATTEGGHLIQGNRIGGGIPGISGSVYQLGDASVPSGQLNQVLPIRIGSSSSTNTIKIYGNTIRDMEAHINYSAGLASGFLGILVSVGNVEIGGDGVSTGNIIGDTGQASSIRVYSYQATQGQRTNGIRILGSITSSKIKNNLIGGFMFKNLNSSSTTVNEVIGIQQLSSGANSTCYIDSNYIGSATVSNSMQNASGSYGAALVGGIQANPNGSSHTHYIRSNTIRNLYNAYIGSSASSQTFGIMAGTATSVGIFKIDSNVVRNLVSLDSNITTGVTASMIGIGLSTGTTQSNPEILRNYISNMTASAGNTSMYGIFHNNTGTGSVVGGNKVWALSNASATGTFTNISGITNFSGNGVTISNNQVSLTQSGSSTNSMIGMSDNTTANTQNWHYNTVYIGGSQSGTVGSVAFGRSGSGSTLNIRNNIFYNAHTSPGTNYIYSIPTAWSSTTSMYNLFIAADTSNCFYVTGTATTRGFGSWVANVSDGSGSSRANTTTTILASQFFVSASAANLNINSDYCEINGRGTTVSTNTDIDGEGRSGSPDFGSDEINMNFEVGVSSINNPTTGLNRTSTEAMKVYIKNYSGSVSIPSGTYIKAGFMVDGVVVGIQNFSIAAALNPGDSVLVTFTATANVGAYTTHSLKAWTQICDGNSSNDSTSINMTNYLGDDLGVTAMAAPGTACTYSNSQLVAMRFKNLGNDTAHLGTTQVTVRTRVTLPGGSVTALTDITVNSGNMLPGDSMTVYPSSNLDMSVSGNYIFKSWTIYSIDGDHTNDTFVQTVTVVAPIALPYSQDFNASGSTPTGWTLSGGFAVNSNGTYGTNGIRINNNSSSTNGSAVVPKIGPTSSLSAVSFDYKITNVSGGGATTLSSQDSILIQVSSDCGQNYATIGSVNSSNHAASSSFANRLVSLSAYAGQNIIVRLVGKTTGSTSNNYYIDIDNVNVFNQASMVYSSSTTTQYSKNVLVGASDEHIVGLRVVTSGNINPLVLNSIKFGTTGTTNPANLLDAKIFYTGTNNSFSTIAQVGSTISNPNGFYTVTFTSPIVLSSGTNYFWISYSVSSSADVGNRIDAAIDLIKINSVDRTPAIQAPAGDRMIYYCNPMHTNSCGAGYINGVQLGTINNTASGCSSSPDSAWSNYFTSSLSTLTTNLRGNNNYTLTLTNSGISQKVGMWIDYNRNGVYEATEYHTVSSALAGGASVTYSFTMPGSVSAGITGLRIRCVDSATTLTATDACTTFANGETEDYKVTLQTACDWTGAVSTAWNIPGNWASNSVPTTSDNARIPVLVTNMPLVSGSSFCRNLTIDTGANLTIITGGNLYIMKTYNRYGELNHNGGNITFYNPQPLPVDTHIVLSLNGAGTYTMLGNTRIATQLVIGSGTTLDDGGNIITIAKDIINNGTHIGTGKMVFAGVASQNIAGSNNVYKNVELTSSFTIRTVNNMTITGNLGLNPGTLSYQGVNVNIGTSTSSDSVYIYGSGNLVNTASTGTLNILGGNGASVLVGLRLQTKAPVFIHRPKGVRLGGDILCDGATTLDTGLLDLNGYNANVGTMNTATSSLTTNGGSFTNSSVTSGTLSLYGTAAASPMNNVKLGSQYKVSVWRPAGISLGEGFNINNLFTLSKGFVDLNGHTVTLVATANILELPGQTFKGATGSIQITKTYSAAMSATNLGSLGLILSTNNNPGVVTVSRSHDYFTNGSGGKSIKRSYIVSASNGTGLVASGVTITYDSTELNGSNRNYLRVNYSTNYGSTFNTYNTTARSVGNNPTGWTTTYAGASLASTTLFTLSDSLNSPLKFQTGVSQVVTNNNVKVYPVPFNENLTIDIEGAAKVSMYDMEGRLVLNAIANGTTVIPTQALTYGVYMLRIDGAKQSTVLKVVKQ